MPIIEGVGDEVTQFFIIVFCGIIAYLAWWSTAQRPHRFRTAVIVDRNFRHIYRFFPRTQLVRSRRLRQHMLIISGSARNNRPSISAEADEQMSVNNTSENNIQHTLEDTEMNNIMNTMETDNEPSVLRNRRLAFFENRMNDIDDSSENNNENDHSEVNNQSNSSEIKLETDESKNTDKKSARDDDAKVDKTDDVLNENSKSQKIKGENETDNVNNASSNNADNIRIRLKFLNNDLRLVEGNLNEPLSEFKRRHFTVELSAQKLVRLIFNGQVLQGEGATLQSCGLFDNCVVHCLVHQPRTQQQFAQMQQQLNPNNIPRSNNNNRNVNSNQNSGAGIEQTSNGIAEERDWDLGHILFTMLASLLSIAWYIHIRFSSLFGIAASLAMFGLTGLYVVAVICVYFPDNQRPPTFNILHRHMENQERVRRNRND